DASDAITRDLLAAYGSSIRVVRHERNTGFATACNDGAAAAAAGAEYLVFLNNDTIAEPGWLDTLVRYADARPTVAVVGSKLLFPGGTVQHAGVVVCQDGYPRHVYSGFPGDHPAVNKTRRFQIVTAACALVRRPLFDAAGGFDTTYRNGYEDVDLCLRLGAQGHEVHYCHESVLYHLESLSRAERTAEYDHNDQLYRSRWADRVRPDEFTYYLEDGLITVSHTYHYPMRLRISPLLAVVEEHPVDRMDDLVDIRAKQVFNLVRENIRLMARVREAELRNEVGAARSTRS